MVAILIVAVVYGKPLSWAAVAVAGGMISVVLALARAGFRSVPLYVVAGAGLWLAMDASGIHPSVAGVVLGILTPAREWVSGVSLHRILERVGFHATPAHARDALELDELRTAEIAAREAVSPVERIEFRMHPWSAFFIMPVFALANAPRWSNADCTRAQQRGCAIPSSSISAPPCRPVRVQDEC